MVGYQAEYEKLKEKIRAYYTNFNFDLLERAFQFACEAHEGQTRTSGDPYIIHPICVAEILAELELDITSIISGLLHDVVEDTKYTLEDISARFGKIVADIVDGVTKLEKIPYATKEDQQAENTRKMFLAMSNDLRVILVKLADRLHNMRTMQDMPPEHQRKKSAETRIIFAPLAHVFGLYNVYSELEDLCFRYLEPREYNEIKAALARNSLKLKAPITEIAAVIEKKAREAVPDARIEYRLKHMYSIHKKMISQNKKFEQIYDIYAIRVIVNTVDECYSVLGKVHEAYMPIHGRLKDYISRIKGNQYQSLHTTLMGNPGVPFEVQIRTWDMHRVAEFGIAAHWKYKEGGTFEMNDVKKNAVLHQLEEWRSEMQDAGDFVESMPIDLYTETVYALTPKGDNFELPIGSTPIDFAYRVHSAIGNRMNGARVNGRIVPISYALQNGDTVEIITTAAEHGPSRDWLGIVKSNQAKTKIKQWFKHEARDENIVRGKEMVEHEIKRQGYTAAQLLKPDWVDRMVSRFNFNTLDDAYSAVGYEGISSQKLVSRLVEEYAAANKAAENSDALMSQDISGSQNAAAAARLRRKPPENGVLVRGIDNCLVRLSHCCSPVPGDLIIGYITRSRGVTVHRADCGNARSGIDDNNRLIEVSWYEQATEAYQAGITIIANDRASLLTDITTAVGALKVPLKAINARVRDKSNNAIIDLTVETSDKAQLEDVINRLNRIESIIRVARGHH